MTSNIFSILNTAKAGLLSQQLGIEVVGHNIANVQTEGFTRQEVNFSTARPRQTGLGLLGTGVRVDSITRDFDKFLFNQILGEGSSTGNFGVRSGLFKTIEILFNTTTGRNLSGDLDDLFLAFDDLAINPSGLAERTTVVANAETLTSNFNLLGKNLFQERINADLSVNDTVSEINLLLDEIASLNSSIHSIETGLSPANDLRDKRDLA
ncbi:MAG: flagellar hook-associated protein FlgK, partial [Nitrospina sp.]